MIIDGKKVPILLYESVIDSATRAGVYIPTLCDDVAFVNVEACCRLCLVEITQNGKSRIVSACETKAEGNMEISTNSENVQRARRTILQLMYSEAPENETILKIMKKYGVEPNDRLPNKEDRACIQCKKCINACKYWSKKKTLGKSGRGINSKVDTPNGEPSDACIGCATCQINCPINVIETKETHDKRIIWGKEFDLLYCENCGKLLTTKENFEEAYYEDAPKLCYDCSELYRKEHRNHKYIFDL